jgi:hypothetical protein
MDFLSDIYVAITEHPREVMLCVGLPLALWVFLGGDREDIEFGGSRDRCDSGNRDGCDGD